LSILLTNNTQKVTQKFIQIVNKYYIYLLCYIIKFLENIIKFIFFLVRALNFLCFHTIVIMNYYYLEYDSTCILVYNLLQKSPNNYGKFENYVNKFI